VAVRLRLRVRSKSGGVAETIALPNSGFETPTPQLLIPVSIAKSLNLWPPEGAYEVVLDTAGGPLRAWFYPRSAYVGIMCEDVVPKEVEVDIVVSPIAMNP
jgi:hypothetical protein